MPELHVQVAVAKVTQYASGESGDSIEMIERPHGGLSMVMVDGQRSGRAAKSISNIVVRKAISLLGDGVRDGAVARAAHDYLRTMRGGQVSATLNIVSVDMDTETLVISRNSHCPTIVVRRGELLLLDQPSEAVGIHARTKPIVTEMPLASDTYVIAFTDGALHAGSRSGTKMDVVALVRALVQQAGTSAQTLADAILDQAIRRDQGRPGDDISVLVVTILARQSDKDEARRMTVDFPIRVQGAIPGG
ncbi:MAG: serine/threonine-protein phosphatase [Anaerolineae bacterium]|nr:serine/threonine-protein phosphatase [Anaerolineae bacterium]